MSIGTARQDRESGQRIRIRSFDTICNRKYAWAFINSKICSRRGIRTILYKWSVRSLISFKLLPISYIVSHQSSLTFVERINNLAIAPSKFIEWIHFSREQTTFANAFYNHYAQCPTRSAVKCVSCDELRLPSTWKDQCESWMWSMRMHDVFCLFPSNEIIWWSGLKKDVFE